MMRAPAFRSLLAIGTTLALSTAVLAGCGSSDEPASNPTPSANWPAPTAGFLPAATVRPSQAAVAEHSHAQDVNDRGIVVGTSTSSDGQEHAFLYRPHKRRLVDLGTLPGDVGSQAYAVNVRGVAVGSSFTFGRSEPAVVPQRVRATRWGATDLRATDLGSLGGSVSVAWDINDRQQVVGASLTRRDRTHAFLWRPKTHHMVDLGTLGGGYSTASALNNKVKIVGASWTHRGKLRAFLWHSRTGTMVNLGTFGAGATWVAANDINNRGQVVGTLRDRRGRDHAFLWRPRTQRMVDLGTLGGQHAHANGVNEAGQVVGRSETGRGTDRAFLWDPETHQMINLGTLHGFSEAAAINEDGWITGESAHHAVLWKPRSHRIIDLGTLVERPGESRH